jgi:hypothetical protein
MPFTSTGRTGCFSSTGRYSGRPYCWRLAANTIATCGLLCRHDSRIESWLRQLMSRSVTGSRIESMWLTWPARLKSMSWPCTRWSMAERSRTSAMLTRTLSL